MLKKLLRRAASRSPRPATDHARKRAPRRLRLESLEDRCVLSGDIILHWNELLLQSLGSPPPAPPPPPTLSRNLALVHVAMFDAVNSIDRSYEPYFADISAAPGASPEAAAAQAAYETLAALYPSREPIFAATLMQDLEGIPDGPDETEGIRVGHEVAQQILELRRDDGSSRRVPYTPPNMDPGQWQPTFPDFSPAANAHVPLITPFAVESSSQFRPGPPPPLTSAKYAADVNEVKTLGSATGSTRTDDQTLVAGLWRLPLTNHTVWNRVAQDVADERDISIVDTARLFALLNVSLNDGLQTSNESKFHYELWRPITAIWRADEDGNAATEADPNWRTLHPNTPPYPAYASNASAIGAACATVLTDVFGRDVSFDIDWGPYGFPEVTSRPYADFWAAADEMANSRIYGGIHFRFDCEAGQKLGFKVAHYVVKNFLLPRDTGDAEEGGLSGANVVAPGSGAGAGVGVGLTSRGHAPTSTDSGWFLTLTLGTSSQVLSSGSQGDSSRGHQLTTRVAPIDTPLGREQIGAARTIEVFAPVGGHSSHWGSGDFGYDEFAGQVMVDDTLAN